MKTRNKLIAFILLCIAICFADNLMAQKFVTDSLHHCKYALCPYNGNVTMNNYKECVADYTGELEGSEPFALDCLHILTPEASYEELLQTLQED